MLLSLESGKLCGNASEQPVAVDRFRIVSTVTSGPVSWSLLLIRWRVTWRGDRSRLLLTVHPEMTVLSVQRHWLWRMNLRNFGISQYLTRNVWRALDVSPFNFTLVVPLFRTRALRSFFLTSRAIFLFRHAHALLFRFHDCEWQDVFQPS